MLTCCVNISTNPKKAFTLTVAASRSLRRDSRTTILLCVSIRAEASRRAIVLERWDRTSSRCRLSSSATPFRSPASRIRSTASIEVGEAGTLGSTPCIVSAAVDALSEFGVRHIDMMLPPEKLWKIIHGGQS